MTEGNPVYPKAKEGFLAAAIDVPGDTIKLQAYDDDVVYDDTDEFIDDVTGTAVGAAVELTGKAITDGQVTGDVGAFGWAAGATITALVVYQDTGVAATSRVIAFLDEKADGTPISIPTTGDSILLHWLDPIFSIGG